MVGEACNRDQDEGRGLGKGLRWWAGLRQHRWCLDLALRQWEGFGGREGGRELDKECGAEEEGTSRGRAVNAVGGVGLWHGILGLRGLEAVGGA